MSASPSPWVVRFAHLVPPGGKVLDVACGSGRHTRFFLERGHPVVAVDRDLTGVQDLEGHAGLELLETDLEDGRPFPFRGQRFAGVVVTNYLYRPILADLVNVTEGVLLYETFARGSPHRPDFLLEPGELLEAVRGKLHVVAYEELAGIQRICAAAEPEANLPPRSVATRLRSSR
jgi:SAM-dependent methyltransferase